MEKLQMAISSPRNWKNIIASSVLYFIILEFIITIIKILRVDFIVYDSLYFIFPVYRDAQIFILDAAAYSMFGIALAAIIRRMGSYVVSIVFVMHIAFYGLFILKYVAGGGESIPGPTILVIYKTISSAFLVVGYLAARYFYFRNREDVAEE